VRDYLLWFVIVEVGEILWDVSCYMDVKRSGRYGRWIVAGRTSIT